MSKNSDNENKFVKDFSEKVNDENTLVNNSSEITIDTNQFDKTLEIMSQTLANIDVKMDVENLQLKKLNQLSEIKNQLNRLETTKEISVAAEVTNESEVTSETADEISEEIHQSSFGHNQQEISELFEKIDILEKKIAKIENQSNNSSQRFEKIESATKRFEDLENNLPNLFKNLFKKKEKIEPDNKNLDDNSEIQSEIKNTTIPKVTTNIIEEAEDSLKNTMSETLILDDYKENISDEDKKPKSNNLKYGLGMFLFLGVIIIILFFFNKFQIINLNIDQISTDTFSLINSIITKFLFYFN
jgi:chromosome segregation ATPase